MTTPIEFLLSINASKVMPKEYYDMTLGHLTSGQWKAYKFKARVKNDEGWEADVMLSDKGDQEVNATYCWMGKNEYCFTTEDHFNTFVSKSYPSKGTMVFSV